MLFNHCCCDPSCLLFKDDFDRADSTSLGGDWQEVSGNAEINTNRLRTAVLGAGVTVATYVHTSETMVVDVAMAFTSGAVTVERAGVIVNYLDSNNYLYVQLEIIFSTFAGTVSTKLQFYRRSGGINTQLGSTRTIDATSGIANHQMRVCYDGTYLSAMGYREAATKITDGFRAGLFSNSSSAVYFDNFNWYVYSPGCPKCTAVCLSCTSPASTEAYILDFGLGGLTNGSCTYCDDIVGEFVVMSRPFGQPRACATSFIDTATPCLWVYELKRNPCISGAYCGYICITLTILHLSGASFAWRVGIALCTLGGFANWEAMYTSSPVTDCTATTTLTLDTQTLFGCGGSYPATIELRSVV